MYVGETPVHHAVAVSVEIGAVAPSLLRGVAGDISPGKHVVGAPVFSGEQQRAAYACSYRETERPGGIFEAAHGLMQHLADRGGTFKVASGQHAAKLVAAEPGQ